MSPGRLLPMPTAVGSGLAGAEIDQAEIGIDGRRLPDVGAAVQIRLGAIGIGIVRRRPGLRAARAGIGHRPEMPQLLAGLGVERRELAARLAVAAGNAGIDCAFVVERRGGDGVAVLPLADHGAPHLLAGAGVERHEGAVELADEHLALADRHAAIVPAAAHGADALVEAGAVLPDQRAGARVERGDIVIAGGEIHDAVFDDRRAFQANISGRGRSRDAPPRRPSGS